MPPDLPFQPSSNTPSGGPASARAPGPGRRAAALNARFRHHGATAVLEAVLGARAAGRVALVSSFGAESVVLLHLAAMVDRSVPVLFIDTGKLFTETLVYQHELAERLGLRDIRIIGPDAARAASQDPSGTLHRSDPDACCALRKTAPLSAALVGFDGWLTGRKRFQGGRRATVEFFEAEPGIDRIKINPLAHWTPQDIRTYMDENRLPRHPLVARGYPSIGCAPCTTPARSGEDPRAGRWRGLGKTECGLHLGTARRHRKGESA